MSLLRTSEIRAMDDEELDKVIKEMRGSLMHEKGLASMGGAPPNPGKIKALRKNIARLLTLKNEREAKK